MSFIPGIQQILQYNTFVRNLIFREKSHLREFPKQIDFVLQNRLILCDTCCHKMMIKRKRVGLMAIFPLETIILHRVSTEYLPFSMVLQNISCQAHSGASQPTPNGTKQYKRKKQHNKKKGQIKNIVQAHIIRCYHCKNQYGLQYGRKVETGAQT